MESGEGLSVQRLEYWNGQVDAAVADELEEAGGGGLRGWIRHGRKRKG